MSKYHFILQSHLKKKCLICLLIDLEAICFLSAELVRGGEETIFLSEDSGNEQECSNILLGLMLFFEGFVSTSFCYLTVKFEYQQKRKLW
jgi:hypothetical protein